MTKQKKRKGFNYKQYKAIKKKVKVKYPDMEPQAVAIRAIHAMRKATTEKNFYYSKKKREDVV